jgi:hypothetical protein
MPSHEQYILIILYIYGGVYIVHHKPYVLAILSHCQHTRLLTKQRLFCKCAVLSGAYTLDIFYV